MAKGFNLQFNNGEEYLLDWAKATFGSELSRTIKDYLRRLQSGGIPTEQPKEPEDRSAKLESIMIRFFSDIKNENDFISDIGEVGAAAAIDGRFGNLYAKCAGDDRLYLDTRIEFERKFPKLAKIAGMTE
jgi:hypothetical protein